MTLVSFIIPAHNEAQLLGRTLTSIKQAVSALDAPPEIIVVDDASTDGTAEIATAHGVRLVTANCRQIAGARNAGAKVAEGEFFIFVDADTTVNAAAVSAALVAMRDGAVGGGCPFRFDGRVPLYGRVLATLGEPLYRMLRLASGCFLFCTREAFRATGGFDETLFAAEEAAMSRALGRLGRFVMLKEQVTTSARKMRTHSGWEILTTLLRFAMKGRKAVRAREGLEIWYGQRREDPETRKG